MLFRSIYGAPNTPVAPDMAAPVAPNAPDMAFSDSAPRARANKELPSEVVIPEIQQQQPEQIVVDANAIYEKLASAAANALNPLSIGLQVCSEPIGWIKSGADLNLDIVPTVAAISRSAAPQSINSWKFFRNAVTKARDARLSGLPPPKEIAKSAEVFAFKVTTAMNVKPRLDPPMEAVNV